MTTVNVQINIETQKMTVPAGIVPGKWRFELVLGASGTVLQSADSDNPSVLLTSIELPPGSILVKGSRLDSAGVVIPGAPVVETAITIPDVPTIADVPLNITATLV